MRIVATGKVKSGVALGFAPASEPAFRALMGTVLPLVKQHVLSLGGRVDCLDDHVTINLLKVESLIPKLINICCVSRIVSTCLRILSK